MLLSSDSLGLLVAPRTHLLSIRREPAKDDPPVHHFRIPHSPVPAFVPSVQAVPSIVCCKTVVDTPQLKTCPSYPGNKVSVSAKIFNNILLLTCWPPCLQWHQSMDYPWIRSRTSCRNPAQHLYRLRVSAWIFLQFILVIYDFNFECSDLSVCLFHFLMAWTQIYRWNFLDTDI